MYRQFCKNLNHYMNIISGTEGNSSRKRIAEMVLPLADIGAYLESKQNNKSYSKKVSDLIYGISKFSGIYPSIEKLIWELWAYGFDVGTSQDPEIQAEDLEEAAKLIDLLMSTHYFS